MPPSAPALGDPRTLVALRDGSVVGVGPATSRDEHRLRSLVRACSPGSLRARFFGTPGPDRAARRLLELDPELDVALVAESLQDGAVVGHAVCLPVAPARAEVAFLIADSWQGRGLGRLLLEQLIAAARARGLSILTAEALPHNRRMIELLRSSGLPLQERFGAESVRMALSI